MLFFGDQYILDILACTSDPQLRSFVEAFENKVKLGTTINLPGQIQIYGLSITQHQDYSCFFFVDFNDKLQSIEGYPTWRVWWWHKDEPINAIELDAFIAVILLVICLGSNLSPLFFYIAFITRLHKCSCRQSIHSACWRNKAYSFTTHFLAHKLKSTLFRSLARATAQTEVNFAI